MINNTKIINNLIIKLVHVHLTPFQFEFEFIILFDILIIMLINVNCYYVYVMLILCYVYVMVDMTYFHLTQFKVFKFSCFQITFNHIISSSF